MNGFDIIIIYSLSLIVVQGCRIISLNVESRKSFSPGFPFQPITTVAPIPSFQHIKTGSALFRIGFPLVVDERPHTSHGGAFFDPRQFHPPSVTRTRLLTNLQRAAFPPSRPQPQHAFRKRAPTPAQPGRIGHLSLSARAGAVLMAGDEEGAEGGGGGHGEGDVGGDVLPVGLPDGVEGGVAGAGANAGDADDGADDGEDGEAEGGG